MRDQSSYHMGEWELEMPGWLTLCRLKKRPTSASRRVAYLTLFFRGVSPAPTGSISLKKEVCSE
jgi:hypothetical protein